MEVSNDAEEFSEVEQASSFAELFAFFEILVQCASRAVFQHKIVSRLSGEDILQVDNQRVRDFLHQLKFSLHQLSSPFTRKFLRDYFHGQNLAIVFLPYEVHFGEASFSKHLQRLVSV